MTSSTGSRAKIAFCIILFVLLLITSIDAEIREHRRACYRPILPLADRAVLP